MDKQIKKKIPLSSWFFKRVAIAILATGGMALYFFYDGAIGYPKKNVKGEMYNALESGLSGKPLTNPKAKPDVQQAYEAGKKGESWAEFTAQRNLPSKKPKYYTDTQIRNQFIYGAILGLVCLGIIGWMLLMRKQLFLLHDSSFTMPTGEHIEFSDVTSIDLKKWDHGFAKVKYQSDNKVHEVKIDDYKFAGAGAILEKLIAKFPEVEIVGNREWLTKKPEA